MAEDFWTAFQIGYGGHTIADLDARGVALAAIQGLHQLVKEKDARIDALEQQISELQSLRGELAALKAMVAELASSKTKVAHAAGSQ